MRYWLHLGANTAETRSRAHPENECQRSVINFWSSICGNQGISWIFEHIEELLTALIRKNTIYQRNNLDSKIIDIANCQTCKNEILAVEYPILISHNYQTAKSRAIYESIDGPTGRPADNPPNPDRLGDFYRTIHELTVPVYWQPGPPMGRWFSSDTDLHLKWWSGTVANTILQGGPLQTKLVAKVIFPTI